MSNPFSLAAVKVFKGLVQSILDSSPEAVYRWAATGKLQRLFETDLAAAEKAFAACVTGRQIQVAELKAALKEALDDFEFDVANNRPVEQRRQDFWALVGPHFDPQKW